MAFYIKVTRQVADKLKLTSIRNLTADGCVLLWQADLTGRTGLTILEKAASVGGVCLTPQAAKKEIDGTDTPAEVTTPDEFKDQSETVTDSAGEVADEPDNQNEEGGEV